MKCKKMEDLIIFRRQRTTKGQWMSHELPRIKIEMPRGTFVVFKKVADLLKAGNRDAVMFAFSKLANKPTNTQLFYIMC